MIIEPIKFTRKQIIGLIPIQAIFDYGKAKEVLEDVANQAQGYARKQIVEWLNHRLVSYGQGKVVFEMSEEDWKKL